MGVQITIDDQTYTLRDDVDPEELRRRVAQAVFRCEVEQLHLADGHTVLVNWRSVRFVRVDAVPPRHGRRAARPPPPTTTTTTTTSTAGHDHHRAATRLTERDHR